MTRDDIIRMARKANLHERTKVANGYIVNIPNLENLERFAALVAAAECEKVARWMIRNGCATGHGDTIEDLLDELEWQVAEREREACATVAESYEPTCDTCPSGVAAAIRARGEA